MANSVSNAIDGLLGFPGKVGESEPDQHGADKVVTLDSCFSTLVLLDAVGHHFGRAIDGLHAQDAHFASLFIKL